MLLSRTVVLLTIPAVALCPCASHAEDRDSWKHRDGEFRRVAHTKWEERKDRTVTAYREVARTPEYIELLNDGNGTAVALFANRAMVMPGGERVWKPLYDEGGWNYAPAPAPKPTPRPNVGPKPAEQLQKGTAWKGTRSQHTRKNGNLKKVNHHVILKVLERSGDRFRARIDIGYGSVVWIVEGSVDGLGDILIPTDKIETQVGKWKTFDLTGSVKRDTLKLSFAGITGQGDDTQGEFELKREQSHRASP